MFSSINVRIGTATESLRCYVASKWLDFQWWCQPRVAYCKAIVEAHTARSRFAAQVHCARVRAAAAPHVVTVRERFRAAIDRVRPRVRALADKIVATCRAVTAWFEMALTLTLAGR